MSKTESFLNLTKSKPVKQERLHIDVKKKKIISQINGYKFVDKDTKQVVVYIPALEISGYGETTEKADEMLKFNLKEYFQYLTTLSTDKIQIELSKLGWRKGIFKKEFSKAYININGELKNLNAENDHVERLALTTA